MKNSERDEDAFEETPRPKRPARPSDEKAPRKAPPPLDDAYVEDVQELPRRPKSREAEQDEDRPQRRPRYEEEDDEDDRSHRPARRRREDEPYSTLIPYRNVPALIGYYCGMCGLIAILGGIALILFNPVNPQWAGIIYFGVMNGLGGILALLGIILGIVGIVYAGRNPRSRGMGHAITGMVLGVLEILGLLAILIFGVMVSRRF
ncbi:MAG TPA: hypothetical protein VKE98_18835 [Gemmataceae bacterium]|nr:hypothetical protein [Gemmataceae bacterium]